MEKKTKSNKFDIIENMNQKDRFRTIEQNEAEEVKTAETSDFLTAYVYRGRIKL